MGEPLRVVIVGNGIAGIMTAAKLRALEPAAEKLQIEIYTREPFEYYSRIRLPEVFASGLNAGDLAIYKPGWYDGKQIHVYKNQEVVRIDAAERKVAMRGGAEVPYDELVLCMGADSYKPPIRNISLSGVLSVNTVMRTPSAATSPPARATRSLSAEGCSGWRRRDSFRPPAWRR
jgi:NAD(P)H-nitrite reductase large subunit